MWPGVGKVLEEMGEVAQVAAKLISTDGVDAYWDGSNLRDDLSGELGDLLAAITFLRDTNALNEDLLIERRKRKTELFHKWHAAG